MLGLNMLAKNTAIQAKQDLLSTHERENGLHSSRRRVPPFKKQPNSAKPSNIQILTFSNHGLLDEALHALSLNDPSSSPASPSVYMALLKACNRKKSLHHAQLVRSHLAQHQVRLEGSLGDYLVVTLAKCGGLNDACLLHHRLPSRTVYSWTAIISAYVECGESQEALHMYHCMCEDGVEPDNFTFVSLFRACGNIADLTQGRKLHDVARRKGYHMDLFVGASLVTMYGNCGSIAEAEDTFCGLPFRDIVCWSAMLSAYVEQGQGEKALLVYRQMQHEGLTLDVQAFVGALQGCETLGDTEEQSAKSMALEIVQGLHADARKKSLFLDPYVSATLVSLYEKFGTIEEAESVFMNSCKSNCATWTVMLSAYVQNNQAGRSLQFYEQMVKAGVYPQAQTYVVALQACFILAKQHSTSDAEMIAMDIVRAIHRDVRVKGFTTNIVIGTILISMYGKYGSISEAEDVFNRLPQRDIMSWNTMLSAYAEQGDVEKLFCLYDRMKRQAMPISDVTILCILQACSETGSLKMCRELHFTIATAGMDQNSSLVNTLIHAYGSCANMADAQAVFSSLENSDAVSWTACIAGYAGISNSTACLETFDRMVLADMEPDAVTFASLLSACSHDGLVVRGVEYFEYMRMKCGIAPGLQHFCSMVDLLGRAGDFGRLESILQGMRIQPDLGFWLCLLAASRTHNELDIGKAAFYAATASQSKDGAAFILMSNIICNAGLWRCVDALEDVGLE